MTATTDHWNARAYADNARFVADLAAPLLELLAPQPGERILDLGCGDGVLTRRLEEYGCDVLGVDASTALLEQARQLGLKVQQQDGQKLAFANKFDAVFSNAALHWMTNPAAVVQGVARALKPGGRFVAEMGGQGNVAAIEGALKHALAARGFRVPEIWYFPAPEEYAELLERHGFRVRSIELLDRPTPLPTGITGWLATFAAPWLQGLPEADAQAILAETEQRARAALYHPATDTWTADYKRLRFAAVKPA